MPAVSTHVLRTISRAAAQMGVGGERLFAAAEVPPELAWDVDQRVECTLAFRLTETAAAMAADPQFGLRLAKGVQPTALGAIGHLLLAASTPRQALEAYAEFQKTVGEGLFFSLRREPGTTVMVLRRHPELARSVPRHNIEALLAGLTVTLASMLPEGEIPVQAMMRHAPQPPLATYKDIFGGRVAFEASEDALRFDDLVLDRPTLQGQPELFAWLRHHTREVNNRLGKEDSTKDRLQRFLLTRMQGGTPTLGICAAGLNFSPRTLQRRLHAEGTTFQEVADAARRRIATAHLSEGVLSVAEVAFLLGFEDESAFRKACQRWFGHPPSAFRSSS